MSAAPTLPELPRLIYEPLLRRALREDLGRAGDVTTDAIVERDVRARGLVSAREAGRVAGISMACRAFTLLDETTNVELLVQDGEEAGPGTILAIVEGAARAILTGERTALNLLGHLSGIASATAGIVQATAGSRARVVCTRKTTPGLRTLEKYAVRAGGGANHRFGLDDAVLIKDNHIVVAGGIEPALERVRAHVGHMLKIEVEVDTLDQLEECLRLGADAVLLDNMSAEVLREAVEMVGGRALTEASGRIRPETAAAVAASGVDLISVGWITHSAPSLDVGLDLQLRPSR